MTPTFIFSTGRSGSTLLQRLLNAHPLAYIYGEHNGILRPLTESIPLLELNANLSEKHGRLIRNKVDVNSTFIAWARPFDRTEYLAALREFIQRLYKVESLPLGSVWGFKEIRYGKRTAAGLFSIFPECKLIILQRQFPGYFLSWSRAFNKGEEPSYNSFKELAQSYVEKYDGLLRLQGELGTESVAHVTYETLAQDAWPAMAALFDWLDLSADPLVEERTRRAAAVRVDYVSRNEVTNSAYLSEWLGRLNSEEPELSDRLRHLSAAAPESA